MLQSMPQHTRARDLGIPFTGQPGAANAITDVPGVRVGYQTIVDDLAADVTGPVAVRTGVTAILPSAQENLFEPTWAAISSFNGNGEMTGAHWINESGTFTGPIMLTNTHSVGMVHHASLQWLTRRPEYDAAQDPWLLPVVAETCDDVMNDINGFHVTAAHVSKALENAAGGSVLEGNVGGGTGMRCYAYKGGTGTASRALSIGNRHYTLGALVQANFGRRDELTIRGVPVGELAGPAPNPGDDSGSLIVVIATDAPLLPLQLQRIARRCALGMGRTGTSGNNGSGDLFIAFSTARSTRAGGDDPTETMSLLPAEVIDPLFRATVESTEEAIINALVAAETMVGHRGRKLEAIDREWLSSLFGESRLR
ncbi:MAG: D-aminopeptidase [Parasphingorhabdus sp.]|jgi:D-aminopeptidase